MKNIKKWALTVIAITALYFVIVKPVIINPYLLRNNHRFTIGQIIKIEEVAEGNPAATYIFNVNGKEYKGNLSMPSYQDFNVGEKYFIMFYVKNPQNSSILIHERTNRQTDDMPDDAGLHFRNNFLNIR